MDFNIDGLIALAGPILAVAIGAALIKKALSLAVTLGAILIIAYIIAQNTGISIFPF